MVRVHSHIQGPAAEQRWVDFRHSCSTTMSMFTHTRLAGGQKCHFGEHKCGGGVCTVRKADVAPGPLLRMCERLKGFVLKPFFSHIHSTHV